MATYTDDELLDAIKMHMSADKDYRDQLEDAVSSKSSHRLRDLIAKVAKWFFGEVVVGFVESVIKHLFGW